MKNNLWIVGFVAIAAVASAATSYGRGFGGFHGGGGFGGGGFGGGGGFDRGGFGGGGGGFHGFNGGGFGGGGFHPADSGGFGGGGFHGYSGMGGGDIHANGGMGGGGFNGGQIRPYGGVGGLPGGLASFDHGLDGMRGGLPRGGSADAGEAGRADSGRKLTDQGLNSFLGLPTDMGLRSASGAASAIGYSGSARGLSAIDSRSVDGSHVIDGAAIRGGEGSAMARSAAGDAIARGAAGNALARGAVTHNWSPADLRVYGNQIRHAFANTGIFGESWYDTYGGAILAGIVGDQWSQPTWTTVNNWFSTNWTPFGYDYGDELNYDGGNVSLYGQPIATAAQYWQSASQLSSQGQQAPPKDAQWLPLGVFAAVRGEQKTTDRLFQLAVDKEGTVRGNYFDTVAKNAQKVEGAVDKLTQRITWVVEDRKDIIFDTGLYNLTKEETAVLVHFGKDKTEQWMLVRLKQTTDTTKK